MLKHFSYGQIAFPGALKLQDVDKSGIVDLDDVVDLGVIIICLCVSVTS